MQSDSTPSTGEMLRRAMRHWVTGVAIVTSRFGDSSHGMTVNSFASLSLDPPMVTVTMANDTRTFHLVQQSGIFAVTILSDLQVALAERFAGRGPEPADRMAGMDVFSMVTGAPLIQGGTAFVDCRVIHQHPLQHSTLLIAEVLAAAPAAPGPDGSERPPLVYFNRTFTRLG
ncbi:MAG TPA: flavin reductase family protein [Anaerolineaceae bacterium]